MNVNVCEQCGDVFDSTGYPVCPDCQFEHMFIRTQNEKTNNKKSKNGESQQGDERI